MYEVFMKIIGKVFDCFSNNNMYVPEWTFPKNTFFICFENRIAGADQDVLQSETEFQAEQADLAQTTLNLALRFAAYHAVGILLVQHNIFCMFNKTDSCSAHELFTSQFNRF